MGDNALVVNIPPKRFGRLGRADVRLASKGTSMSASIHPPVQLHIVLDEDSYQGGDSVEMARRFTAVAPTEVVRAAKGSQRANVLRFDLGDDTVTAEADDDRSTVLSTLLFSVCMGNMGKTVPCRVFWKRLGSLISVAGCGRALWQWIK